MAKRLQSYARRRRRDPMRWSSSDVSLHLQIPSQFTDDTGKASSIPPQLLPKQRKTVNARSRLMAARQRSRSLYFFSSGSASGMRTPASTSMSYVAASALRVKNDHSAKSRRKRSGRRPKPFATKDKPVSPRDIMTLVLSPSSSDASSLSSRSSISSVDELRLTASQAQGLGMLHDVLETDSDSSNQSGGGGDSDTGSTDAIVLETAIGKGDTTNIGKPAKPFGRRSRSSSTGSAGDQTDDSRNKTESRTTATVLSPPRTPKNAQQGPLPGLGKERTSRQSPMKPKAVGTLASDKKTPKPQIKTGQSSKVASSERRNRFGWARTKLSLSTKAEPVVAAGGSGVTGPASANARPVKAKRSGRDASGHARARSVLIGSTPGVPRLARKQRQSPKSSVSVSSAASTSSAKATKAGDDKLAQRGSRKGRKSSKKVSSPAVVPKTPRTPKSAADAAGSSSKTARGGKSWRMTAHRRTKSQQIKGSPSRTGKGKTPLLKDIIRESGSAASPVTSPGPAASSAGSAARQTGSSAADEARPAALFVRARLKHRAPPRMFKSSPKPRRPPPGSRHSDDQSPIDAPSTPATPPILNRVTSDPGTAAAARTKAKLQQSVPKRKGKAASRGAQK